MRIGIDLGGSKTELIALDERGVAQTRFRRPTPSGDYEATVRMIVDMVRQAELELAITASIGIGTPGAASLKTGRMKNCNSTCLNDQPLQQDIERLLERDIRKNNDANCFALSEAVDGAGAGYATVFGVILGTGVGGGIVMNGQAYVFSDEVRTRLLPPLHGDSSGVRGAAWLWGE